MTTIIRTLHLSAPAALLLLFLGCSGGSPVKIEPLSSAFTTAVLTESWLAIEHDGGVTVMRPDGTDARFLPGTATESWSPGAVWLGLRVGRGMAAYDPSNEEMIPLFENGIFGAWSPDATNITYTPSRTGGLSEVWIQEIASGEYRILGQGTAVDWSSDGEWIAAVWSPPDLPGGASRWIHLLRTDQSGDVRDLGQLGGVSQGAFSADSRWVRYWAGSALYPKLRAVSVDGTEDLLLHASLEFGGLTSWSPTGDDIAFAATPGGFQLYITSPHRATRTLNAFGVSPRWSPDGAWLGYGPSPWHPSTPPNAVRVISTRSSQKLLVGETNGSFSWSPDSQLMAIAAPEGSSNGIYLVDFKTGEKRRVADGDRVLWSPPIRELTSP